jgi:hypothetical protein
MIGLLLSLAEGSSLIGEEFCGGGAGRRGFVILAVEDEVDGHTALLVGLLNAEPEFQHR